MPVIFSRSFDGHFRQAGVGLVVVVSLFAIGWYYYALPSYTRVGYTPEQPVPSRTNYTPANSVWTALYCHQSVFDSPQATVPTSRACMNCHDRRKRMSKAAARCWLRCERVLIPGDRWVETCS